MRTIEIGTLVDLAITCSTTSTTGQTMLHIKDTGPGIPLTERARIFDPFYRMLGSEEVGSGLGLSIVKTVVDRIGGTITLDFAEETTHTGLHVVVTLPHRLASR